MAKKVKQVVNPELFGPTEKEVKEQEKKEEETIVDVEEVKEQEKKEEETIVDVEEVKEQEEETHTVVNTETKTVELKGYEYYVQVYLANK